MHQCAYRFWLQDDLIAHFDVLQFAGERAVVYFNRVKL